MADTRARIILSAEDRTKAAFDQAKRNLLSVQNLARSLGAVGGVAAARAIVGQADAYANLNARIRLVTASSGEFTRAQESVFAISQSTRTGLADTAGLFTALARSTEGLGKSQGEVLGVTETINKAIQVSGTSAKSTAAALVQLGQGFASGVLRGEELTSVLEQAPRLAKAIADGLGVSIGELRKLGKDGELTAERVFDALQKSAATIDAEFSRLPVTVGAATTQAGNALQKLIGVIDETSGTTTALASAISVAAGLISDLANEINKVGQGAESANLLANAFVIASETLRVLGANVSFVFAGVGREIVAIAAQIVALGRLDIKGFTAISDAVREDAQRARAELDAFEARVLQRAPRSDPLDTRAEDARFRASIPRTKPVGDTKGKNGEADRQAREALAALRQLADNRVKLIRAGVEEEVDVLRFREQILGVTYQQQNVSLAAFYGQQDKLRADALEATRRAIAAEIAVRQDELKAKGLKPADKLNIEQEIAEARARLAKAEREAGQDAERATADRQAATAALGASVRQLQAEIAGLAGDRTAQPLLEVAERVAAARKLLTSALPAGADASTVEPQVQQYERLLKLQIQLNEARNAFGIVSERLQISEERIALAQQTGAIGELEALQRVGQARSAVIDQLREHLRTQEAIAAATNDPDVLLGIERTRLEIEKLAASLDPLKDKFDNLFKDAGATFLDDLIGGKGLKAALRSFGHVITSELNRSISKDLSASIFGPGGIFSGAGKAAAGIFGGQPNGIDGGFAGSFGIDAAKEASDQVAKAGFSLSGIFGTLTGAATGSADVLGTLPSLAAIPATTSIGALGVAAQIAATALTQLAASSAAGSAGSAGSLFGSLGSLGSAGSSAADTADILGMFLHQGGIAGRDGKPTRYHSGGIAGLMPDEVPAILRRGEEVLTQNDPRHRSNMGRGSAMTMNYSPSFVIQGPIDRRTQEQIAASALTGARQAMSRGTAGGTR